MPHDARLTLRAVLRSDPASASREFLGGGRGVTMAAAAHMTAPRARGKAVMLAVRDQFDAARVLVALDGTASRIVVCPPGVSDEHRAAICATGEVETVLDDDWLVTNPLVTRDTPTDGATTEWVLLTSGTTGVPKLVSHDLHGLAGAIAPPTPGAPRPTWATFYDIRRYGGLQIFLRAVFGAQALVIGGDGETLQDFLRRCAEHGVTHISGTPTHWRRLLMHPPVAGFAPAVVRLSGEIADQAILDALRARFPQAQVGHAYASTEAGVGFEVNDGLSGFPASYVTEGCGPVALKVEQDTLRIRSPRTAAHYIGDAMTLRDRDGFVDTGDIVARCGDRYHFAGRHNGVINIGGQKVHPEEVEAVINRHDAVRMSLVRSRRSPITGAIVAAEIVLRDDEAPNDPSAIRQEIETACHAALPAWKVPASIRFVPSLAMTPAGKLARHA